MGLNRTEFLKLSVWGFVATLLPLQQINALSFISNLKSFDLKDYKEATEKAKQAKVHFFKKEYSLAEKLYLKCIDLAPADIRFYDNLQNVYGAQGKFLTCVELFKNGLIANPRKIDFYDRAARSLMRLELGYSRLSKEYRNSIGSNSLLKDALELYKQAIQINSNASFLEIGFNKVEQKIKTNARSINYRKNREHEEERKKKRQFHNKRYIQFSDKELIAKLQEIDSKKRNTLFFENEKENRKKNIVKEKKIIYTTLIKKQKKEGRIDDAIYYANQLYNTDSKDTFAVNVLKRMYRKTKNYNALLDFQIKHNNNTQTVYTNLGLMLALNEKYKYGNASSTILNQSIEIGEDLYKNWSLIKDVKLKVIDKLSQTYSLKNDFESANYIIKKTIKEEAPFTEGMINSLIHSNAKVYFEIKKYNEAKDILLLGLKDFDKVNREEFAYINEVALTKKQNNFSTNLKLKYLLFTTYRKLDDNVNSGLILKELLQNNPEDKFALKHS